MFGILGSDTSSSTLSKTIATTTIIFTILATYALWESHAPCKRKQRIRRQLPSDLGRWRLPGSGEGEEQIWRVLDEVFRDAGFTLWTKGKFCNLKSPGRTYPSSSGFGYAIPTRTIPDQIGNVGRLRRFDYTNSSSRAGRTRDGLDVIIRVIVIGNEGHDHLKILRTIATGENSLFSNNHALPMFAEFQFEDIIFGIFPKAGGEMISTYGYWAKNSVGDIIEMLMQMLEALAFIHDLNIAHRDAFRDNFVIQWHPESLGTMKISFTRPRVYLIDFEVAIQFPAGCPKTECVSKGPPLGGSFSTEPDKYARPHAPEFASGIAYNPFKLDIWQLGISFSDFRSTIPAIDEVLVDMTNIDPIHRLDAKEALDRLGTVICSMTPESLLIKPVVIET